MAEPPRPIRIHRAWLIAVALIACLGPTFNDVSGANGASIQVQLAAIPVGQASEDEAPGPVIMPAGPAVDEGSSGPNVRPRTDRHGSDTIPTIDPSSTTTPTETPEEQGIPRLDDPVLRWLPEIMAASAQWGVPPELIAAVMYVESRGEPGPISPSGARGLMQMMPDQIGGQGVPEHLWHEPATNISAGAQGLYNRMTWQGSWEGAVGAYLGFGCDVWGTCTDVYVRIVFNWASYYKPLIDNPGGSGFPILPANWAYGPVTIFQVKGPPPPEEPPETPTATPTGTGTPDESTRTPEPGDPTPEPTSVPPTEIAPTEVVPTVPPPTAPPPTEVPTEPPSPPTELPADDGTAAAD